MKYSFVSNRALLGKISVAKSYEILLTNEFSIVSNRALLGKILVAKTYPSRFYKPCISDWSGEASVGAMSVLISPNLKNE